MLEVLLNKEFQCDILALTEHCLTHEQLQCVNIENYILVSSFCRSKNMHGGSCLFVKNNYKAIENTDICNLSVERCCEISAVNLIDLNLLIVCIYRSNLTKSADFFSVLERLLDKICDLNINCTIMGDMNIDCLCTNLEYKKLHDMLMCYHFKNVVDFPTRVSCFSATSLDHIYTNSCTDSIAASAVKTNVSDHYGTRAEITCSEARPTETQLVRSYTHSAKINFVAAVDSVDWGDLFLRKPSAEALATSVINILVNKIDVCFPYRKNMQSTVEKSWVTSEILNLNALLSTMKDLKNKFPTNNLLQEKIDSFSELYTRKLSQERCLYYNNIVKDSTNTTKTMWRIVNRESGKMNKPRQDFADVVKDADGCNFKSKLELVNYLNTQFINAASACGVLAPDIARSHKKLIDALPRSDRTLRFRFFTALEIHTIISKKVAKKPTKDIYDISTNLLIYIGHIISLPLQILFNRCLREGVYPSSFKDIKVCPLYKGKGSKMDPSCYRPISIIPAVAKILENGLTTRLVEFLDEINALSPRQYAYRTGRSTTVMVRDVVQKILVARERKLEVAILFCDLSKAFDVADHDILKSKLRHYGIDGPALDLLVDFMSERKQSVVGMAGTLRSDSLTSTRGVPQGSSLSNLAFTLLLNDLPISMKNVDTFMYADDVAIVVAASTVEELEKELNKTAELIFEWFQTNGLALNIAKTIFMQFNLAGRKRRQLDVTVRSQKIQQVEVTTFLGFQVDDGLRWEAHIEKLCSRLSTACFALKRVSSTLSTEASRACYFASVQSLLQYGIEVWGRSADWERAFILQKRAVRILAHVPQDTSARPYFKKLGILTLPSLLILNVVMYVVQHEDEFASRGSKQGFNLRHPNRLISNYHRLVKSSRTASGMGPEVYNRIPQYIKKSGSINMFKSKLKCWLVEESFYSYSEFLNKKIY